MSKPVLPTCIPFPIDAKRLDDVVSKAKDWAVMHGAGMRTKTSFNPDTMQVRGVAIRIVCEKCAHT